MPVKCGDRKIKVIIAGSREITNYESVVTAIKASKFEITEIVSGCARGVDLLGEQYAAENNIPVKQFPAQWDDLNADDCYVKTNNYGKRYNANAGFDRNNKMVDYAEGLIAVIKGKSPGTSHCIRAAEAKSLHVFIYDLDIFNNPTKPQDKVPF